MKALGFDIDKDRATPTGDSYDNNIIDYYSQAGLDYEPWSKKYNMHFGYFRWGINPFVREALLDEMNEQVLSRLQINIGKEQQIIDLGCGVGSTARSCVDLYSNTCVTGATIVPWQIEKAEQMSKASFLQNRLCFRLLNYRSLPFSENAFDGAYAVESSCYDHGRDKSAFLREAFRVLKPGGRLVIADGFRLRSRSSSFFEYCFRQVCRGWSLETFAELPRFIEKMKTVGYTDIKVEDVSWRLLPSVMYVPWVSLKYLMTHILGRGGGKKFQRLHLIAPIFGLIVGLHRRDFSYCLISASKPKSVKN